MPRKVGWCLEGATQGKCIKTRKGEKKKKKEQDRVRRLSFNPHQTSFILK